MSSSPQTARSVNWQLSTVPRWLGALLILGGVSNVLGWWLEIPMLRLAPDPESSMPPNIALCLAILGVSIASLTTQRAKNGRQPIPLAGAAFSSTIAAATLSQDFLSIDVGLDSLLLPPLIHVSGVTGRMSPQGAIAVLALSLAIVELALSRKSERSSHLVLLSALVALLIGLLGVLSHHLGFHAGQQWGSTTSLKLAAACAFIVAAIALGLIQMERTPLRIHFDRRTAITLSLSLGILAVLMALSWETVSRSHDVHLRIGRTANTRQLLSELRAEALELQTAHSDMMHHGMVDAVGRISMSSNRVRFLLARIQDELPSEPRIAHINDLLKQWLQTGAPQVESVKRSGKAPPPDPVLKGVRIKLIADARQHLRELDQSLQAGEMEESLESQHWHMFSEFALPMGGLLSLLAVVAAIAALNRETGRRHEVEERWNLALIGSDLGVWDWDARANTLYYSDRWCTMLGYSPREIGNSLEEWKSRIHPDDYANVMARVEEHMSGITDFYASNHRLRTKDGGYKWIHDVGKTVEQDEAGRPTRVIGTHTDITSLMQEQERTRVLQEQLQGILTFSPNLIMLLDVEDRFLVIGDQAVRHIGRPSGEILGRTPGDVMDPVQAELLLPNLKRMRLETKPFDVELNCPTKEGIRIHHTQFYPLFDAQARHYATGVNSRDVTEARTAVARTERALAEREVLLREIHHRVKNNLQIVSSLLGLQARAMRSPELRAAFDESNRRIASMALIHEQLYRHDDLARIDFAKHLDSIIHLTRTAYGVSRERVAIELDVQVPHLELSLAIPCGLIVNELLANACKHAFGLERAGRIRIHIRAESPEWTIIVEDNGALNPTSGATPGTGLGLQLVNALARQLKGRVNFVAESTGCRVTVNFLAPDVAQIR